MAESGGALLSVTALILYNGVCICIFCLLVCMYVYLYVIMYLYMNCLYVVGEGFNVLQVWRAS